MELRVFAEQILFGTTLAEKWAVLEEPSDVVRGTPIAVPASPGRPAQWRFGHGRTDSLGLHAPLEDGRQRIRLLHALANHELLALELFALALLRFPDAPAKLRRGWAAAASDEQQHMRMYVDRIRAMGGEFGEEELSGFFWSVLATADSADAFAIGMGLVLEQANLDYTRWWHQRFASVGDHDTAQVLERVHADEVRHVRLAVRHLREIQEASESEYQTFTRYLRFPLTPARAKGPTPDRQARRSAGLTDAFIDELLVASHSKGRHPTVFYFDAGAEDELAGRPSSAAAITRDLAHLPMWLASADDIVVAPKPSLPFLRTIGDLGISLPRFVELDELDKAGPLGAWRPWALTPLTGRRFERWVSLPQPEPSLFSKAWAIERAREWLSSVPAGFPIERELGMICATAGEVEAAGLEDRWIKAAYSASGTHRIRVRGPLTPAHRTWLERTLLQGPVIVERCLDVVAEFSVQGEIDREVRTLGVTRFGATRGVYRGSVVGSPLTGCGPELRRFVMSAGRNWAFDLLSSVAEELGSAARDAGLRGPFGVDAFVVRSERGLLLKPISEFNPRMTMGRVALALKRKIHSRSVGLWLFVPAASLGTHVPALPSRIEDGKLASGVLATTDARGGATLTTWLFVGRNPADVREVFDRWASVQSHSDRLLAWADWFEVP